MHFWPTAQTPFAVNHPSVAPLVSLFAGRCDTIWEDTLIVPALVAAASVVVLLLHLFLASAWECRLRGTSEPDAVNPVPVVHAGGLVADVKEHVAQHGGGVIFSFKLVRLLACLTLLGLSIASLAITEGHKSETGKASIFGKWGEKHHKKNKNESPALSVTEWLQLAMCTTFFYGSILAIVTVSAKRRWSQVAVKHLSTLLTVTLLTYGHRDLFPLITYHRLPLDLSEGWILWGKVIALLVADVVVPLFIPRLYIPVDPKNPMPVPNSEQTASIMSAITYSFLDPIVFLGSRVPHLTSDQLPVLADYDYSANLKARNFKHLEVSVSNKRHLFFGLIWTFRLEYLSMQAATGIVMATTNFASPIGINRLLSYLENPNEEPAVKPWFWIIWLFIGPILSSTAFQWYIFLATRTLVRCEAILTQLIFEHALRIRVKTETSDSETKPSSNGTSTPVRSETPSLIDHNDSSRDGTPNLTDADTVSRDEILHASSSSIKSTTSKGKGKEVKKTEPEKSPSTSNLVGKITNLATTDLRNITEGRDFLFLSLYIPLTIALCIAFLYQVLGWSSFVGMGVMILLFPLPGYVAKLVQTVQQQRLKKTDARVQSVTETMNVLRMIKLFGWERQMNERVADKREEELDWLWKRQLLDLLNGTLNVLLPVITMIATYATYVSVVPAPLSDPLTPFRTQTVIMKESLTASKVFSSMSVFDMLRNQLSFMFWELSQAVTGKVSLDRVNEFLHETELLDVFAEKDSNTSELFIPADAAANEKIGFRDATFAWSSEKTGGSLTPSKRKFMLKIEGEMLFKPGCINLVVGPTGSGKTSLLMALLGEMHFVPSGPTSWYNLPRAKGVSYAAQESWVQNETIQARHLPDTSPQCKHLAILQENILFGAKFDEVRYKKVLYQCALERDLELFEAGDTTEIGEKGLTLSGGQKARITLARAIYANADIILLDDVLAALDVHTAKWIVDKCLGGDLIKGRTVIMVTHNVAMAKPVANYIVSMGIDGHIHSHGSISEALATDEILAEELSKDQEVLDKKTDEIDAPLIIVKADGKLIVAEEVKEGHVSWDSLKLYFKGLGGNHTLLFFTVFLAGLGLTELSNAVQTWFLGYWAGQYRENDPSQVDVFYYLGIFSLLMLIGVILYAGAFVFYTMGVFRASKSIHKQLIESVLGATLRPVHVDIALALYSCFRCRWLDITPTSRVIARCTVDVRAIDGPIAHGLWQLFETSLSMLVKFAAVILFTPLFFVPGVLVGALGGWCGQLYIAAQLGVKREMSNTQAPVLGHFGAAIAGLTSIRAYGAQNSMVNISLDRIDKYTRTARTFYDLNRWVCIRIDALGSLFAAALAYYLVYFQDHNPSNVGFSLNMAIGFSGMILWWVRVLNDFEIDGNSLERIRGYIDIEQEPKPTSAGVPPAYWPRSGKLSVEKLSAKYSADGPKVLHDISFNIESGERVGVVGRTGSGKSSLTLALLRCIFTEGTVYYDRVPTSSINLDTLRSNITIIPQIPELLTGSLRKNLDLFEQYDDATLNGALRAAGLFALQNEMDEGKITLDSEISAGGGNLSVGQRQILALARAIVRGSKLLILDEATSAIDYKTDAVIQSSLRNELPRDTTLLTVAHRLQTIMDADKIMVLDAGRIIEFDTPKELLKNKNGMLRALVDESGDKHALYKMAGA
ncbi:ATP-binding cassette transporter [Mycena venus]|uniref:ATP-binding cassette transporter n=1 Tax=Mycena venus TaxID=2733690 RepID=A0A8H6Z3W2_9AGAR|nr:ATP-binding cassette transporter [Mycena venus]